MDRLVRLIEEAALAIEGVVNPTPIVYSRTFSDTFGLEVFFKLENLQKTGSFKARGAYNKISKLKAAGETKGVIAASSGNHAQGVAWAAALCKVRSVIVMPETAPIIKRVATKGYGAEVILHGTSFTDAFVRAEEVAKDRDLSFVHAFDDELIVAGQGTIGLEIAEQMPDIDTVIVPVGGGGLISGIATGLKSRLPKVQVIGVQAKAYTSALDSVKKGRLVAGKSEPTIADGIAIKKIGKLPFKYIEKNVDKIVSVGEESIAEAVLKLLERKKLSVEGAGAVGLAALMEGKIKLGNAKKSGNAKKKKVLVLLSGGNIDVTMLDRVIRLGLQKEGRIFKFTTIINDKPGALASLTAIIAESRSNILQMHHQRDAAYVPIGMTRLEVILEVEDRTHSARLVKSMEREGYQVGGE